MNHRRARSFARRMAAVFVCSVLLLRVAGVAESLPILDVPDFAGHTDEVTAVAFSPNGRLLATASGDSTVRLWDATTGKQTRVLYASGSVAAVTFSPDSELVALGTANGKTSIWRVGSGEAVIAFEGEGHLRTVTFSPDGAHLLAGGLTKANLWDWRTGELVDDIFAYGLQDRVAFAIFSPDGKFILTAGTRSARRFIPNDGTDGDEIAIGEHGLTGLALTPDGKHLLVARQEEAPELWDVPNNRLVRRFVGHTRNVYSVAFSPDGRYALTASDDATARLWDVATGAEMRRLSGHKAEVVAVAFSPDSRRVLTGSTDRSAILWDAESGKAILRLERPRSRSTGSASPGHPRLVVQLGHSSSVTSIATSPDGRFLVSAGDDNRAILWDVATGAQLRTFAGHSDGVNSVAFSPGGQTVLTGSDDRTARLWDIGTGAEVERLNFGASVEAVAYTPDGRSALVGARLTAELWDLEKRTRIGIFTRPDEPDSVIGPNFGVIAFSPDGRRFLSGGGDSTARLWDVATRRLVRTIVGHTSDVSAVAFSPDGRLYVTGSQDNTARIWNAKTGALVRTIRPGGSWVHSVAFSPDGRKLLLDGPSNAAIVVDVASGRVQRRLETDGNGVRVVAFSPDGGHAMTANGNGTIMWDLGTGAEIRRFDGASDLIQSIAFSPDGRHLMVGRDGVDSWDLRSGGVTRHLFRGVLTDCVDVSSDSRTVVATDFDNASLWDAETGAKLRELKGHTASVETARFSPDNTRVLTTSDDKSIRLWDVATGAHVGGFEYPEKPPTSASFSPDGRRIVTGSEDQTVRIWDARTGAAILKFPGEDAGIYPSNVVSVVFSPDGRQVLAGAYRGAFLFDAESGTNLRTFSHGREEVVESASFSPDGRYVLTAGRDQTARLWDVASGLELRRFEGHEGWVRAARFTPDGRYVATSGHDGTVRFWEPVSGRELCLLATFGDGTWVVVDPEGRFDTNNLERIAGLHWIVSDDPFTPLPVEIFMRDYYEPRLLPRLLAGERLAPVRDLSSLERAQPDVKVVDVTPQKGSPEDVTVRVEVSGASARGVYDLRLFRDGQLVGSAPRGGAENLLARRAASPEAELAAWRAATKVEVDAATASAVLTFSDITLPRGAGAATVEFSAYAFNVDRVKSQTGRRQYALPAGLVPEKGRAYVVTVGVNTYQDPGLDLKFAANDARRAQELVADRLARTGQYAEVVAVALISDRGTEAVASKANIEAVLGLLSGRPGAEAPAVPGAERVRAARPDDLVFILFAGHGYADGRGDFYLVPHDVGANARAQIMAAGEARIFEHPGADGVLARCISSDELSVWLRDIDAGEIVMVVDACQSGAFTGENFKPGPMGSRGLGQLAYDKGMKILAATQADNIALELKNLQHGLVSHVLLHEGIEERQADFKPKDGSILLSEWLGYAVERVPVLYQEMKSGRVRAVDGEQPRIFFHAEAASEAGKAAGPARDVQRPALFDFLKKRREIVLMAPSAR